MKDFARLYERLIGAGPSARREALTDYFAACAPDDLHSALMLLRGRRQRLLSRQQLHHLGLAASGLPEWLFEQALVDSGDLAETVALLVGDHDAPDPEPLPRWLARLEELRTHPDRTSAVLAWWRRIGVRELLVLNHLLLGRLRIDLPDTLLAEALSPVTGLPVAVLNLRLSRCRRLDRSAVAALLDSEFADSAELLPHAQPQAVALTEADLPEPPSDWHVEAHYGGRRLQLVRRDDWRLWDTDQQPIAVPDALLALVERLPRGTVLDLELVAATDTGLAALAEPDHPQARLLVHDLVEAGADLRALPLQRRLDYRHALLADHPELLAPATYRVRDWAHLESGDAPGLLLRRMNGAYDARVSWKLWQGRSIAAVLLYAEPGPDGLYSRFNLAVRNGGELVPVAKVAAELPAESQLELDRWIREHTVERFGPVRSVEPSRIFELRYQGVQASRRHKAGLRLVEPRLTEERPAGTEPGQLSALERALP